VVFHISSLLLRGLHLLLQELVPGLELGLELGLEPGLDV